MELIACKKNIKKRNQWFSSTIAAKLRSKKGAIKNKQEISITRI
jgi:transcription initiation factor IIE alpha subunit